MSCIHLIAQQGVDLELIKSRLIVDCGEGRAYWKDATKHHARLNGQEAGCARKAGHTDKSYWHIKINGRAYKRAHIVFAVANGVWPSSMIDHINGDSLDDRIDNLRLASATQNAWNHKSRKKSSGLPMGIRELKKGRYQARIACHKKTIYLGVFDDAEEASKVYQLARKEYFGDFS